MAEESSSQERSEDATPKRLREARKKGQVSKSRDLNTVVILIAAFIALAAMIPFFNATFTKMLMESFQFAKFATIDTESLLKFLSSVSWDFMRTSGPFLIVMVVIAVTIGFLQTGSIFSPEPVKPQLKRLNIIENVKNMFKMATLVELIKNIVKVVIVFYVAYLVIRSDLEQLLLTVTANLNTSAHIASAMLSSFLIRVLVIFAAIAVLDVLVQRWQYKKQLRMTKEEVKREYKQDEGDPIIKSVRRQLHQELAMGDTRRAVAASDAVITNPTELAIAIKYNEKEMMAPQVMAKGERLFAEKIREFANEEKIPILRNVPLAWSLIELEVGQDIPEELYQAVAEVLIIVYRMKDGVFSQSPAPQDLDKSQS